MSDFFFLLDLTSFQLVSVAQSDLHVTGDQEVMCLIPAGSFNILLWRLIMGYQFLAKECSQILVNC